MKKMQTGRKWMYSIAAAVAVLGGVTPQAAESKSKAGAGETKPAAGAPAAAFKNVSAAEFEKMRAQPNVVVLDVRTPKEYADGHIPGAVNMDVKASDFQSAVAKLDKSKTYLVHCAGGVRSVTACKALAPLQFKELYNLEGGMKAWEKAGNKAVK